MVSLCICIVYICYAFQRISDIFFHHHTDLVYTRFIPWAVFPIYFHCIRSLHFLKDVSDFILDSSQLYVLVYICYIYSCSFPLYLHCICLLQFFVRYAVFFFFFFDKQVLSTSVTDSNKVSLCVCIVHICYTFFFERCAGFA